jgi:hypothetical protein
MIIKHDSTPPNSVSGGKWVLSTLLSSDLPCLLFHHAVPEKGAVSALTLSVEPL